MFRLAPGNILTNYEIKQRIRVLPQGRFLEIGSGHGFLSKILLDCGYTGVGLDLNKESNNLNRELNREFIAKGLYQIETINFLEYRNEEIKYDLIISHLVLEHLNDEEVKKYFEICRKILNDDGLIVIAVPSNMKYWGIEDETTGHVKRYEYKDLEEIERNCNLYLKYYSFLTYPLSNLLLNISNYLIKKHDHWKKDRDAKLNTIESSNRGIKYKTEFPDFFRFFINEIVLYPFIFWQSFNKKNPKGMVLYAEFSLRP